MSTHDPRGLHSATFGDIRRLLVCLNGLHAAPVSVRGRALATDLLAIMDAASTVVCVAEDEGWTVVASERAGRAAGESSVDALLTPHGGSNKSTVTLSPPSDEAGAAAVSVCVDAGRATALIARRDEPFEPKHAVLLELIHPHVVWALASSLATRDLPHGSEPVLELLLTGLREKEIALRLGRSAHTIHGHVKRLYRHFDVSSKSQLIHQHNQRGDVR